MTKSREVTGIKDLTRAQKRALEGLEVLADSRGTAEMATLRANGNRRDVIDRLCKMGLAYAASQYGDPDRIRFALTTRGGELLADARDPIVVKGKDGLGPITRMARSRKPRYQDMLLTYAVGNEGRLKVSARSHFRRSADALERRGLLTFVSSDGFLAYFDITDAGRAQVPAVRTT